MWSPEWITIGAIVVGQVGTLALTIDRWARAHDGHQAQLRSLISQVQEQQDTTARMIDAANVRLSEKMSQLQRHLVFLEMDITRLKAIDEIKYRHD